MSVVKIPEEVWIRHRPTIEHLYISEDRRLERQDGVMQIMEDQHGLFARCAHAESTYSLSS
jgi:hypothetical protein